MLLLRDFLISAPLYSWRSVEFSLLVKDLDPGQMELRCSTCDGIRPFRDNRSSGSGAGVHAPPQTLKKSVYFLEVHCGFCYVDRYVYMVEIDPEKKKARKVGQYPPWSIELSPDIEDALGESKGLFKKGLVCLSQGFGLGACTYFRRALEDQVDSILALLEQLLSTDPNTKAEGKRIADLRQSKTADRRLEQAYPFLPSTLIVDGINPLKLLYGFLSQGVHALGEDDCCQLAEQIYHTHVYVVGELKRAVTSRDQFVKQLKSLRAIKFGGVEGEDTSGQTSTPKPGRSTAR